MRGLGSKYFCPFTQSTTVSIAPLLSGASVIVLRADTSAAFKTLFVSGFTPDFNSSNALSFICLSCLPINHPKTGTLDSILPPMLLLWSRIFFKSKGDISAIEVDVDCSSPLNALVAASIDKALMPVPGVVLAISASLSCLSRSEAAGSPTPPPPVEAEPPSKKSGGMYCIG